MSDNLWRSRIVDHGKIDPREVVKHPLNHRTHPDFQRRVLRELIHGIGLVKSITINRTTGRLIDGHARVQEGIEEIERRQAEGKPFDDVMLDVEYIEVDEAEEFEILASLDATTDLAEVDPDKLAALVTKAKPQRKAVEQMLAQLAKQNKKKESKPSNNAQTYDMRFQVIIDCDDESQQTTLLERFKGENLKCRPLIS